MCQQGEAEIRYTVRGELREIAETWAAYERGDIKLTDDEIGKLVIRKLMLMEAL